MCVCVCVCVRARACVCVSSCVHAYICVHCCNVFCNPLLKLQLVFHLHVQRYENSHYNFDIIRFITNVYQIKSTYLSTAELSELIVYCDFLLKQCFNFFEIGKMHVLKPFCIWFCFVSHGVFVKY